MRTALINGLVAAASVISMTCAAKDDVVTPSSSSQYANGSLCSAPDLVVFSCPLEKNAKIVSICAAGNAASRHFYYAFGEPHAIEMTYPSDGEDSTKAFEQAHLLFPGSTGGYAYSFTKQNYKYILYSISGTGFDIAGIKVQHLGDVRALSDMKCQPGKLTENNDANLKNSIDEWTHDRDIELHGMPHVPRT
jgi:hypothetical protein